MFAEGKLEQITKTNYKKTHIDIKNNANIAEFLIRLMFDNKLIILIIFYCMNALEHSCF